MNILVLANLFPPFHASSGDLRCAAIVDMLRARGHQVRVLTSMRGVKESQTEGEVIRRLVLNGYCEFPLRTELREIRPIEVQNHQALREVVAQTRPDVIHAFSLRGLSKSLLFSLRETGVPTVFDVADGWLSLDLRQDPWIRWWNRPAGQFTRTLLELLGTRKKYDRLVPTRPSCEHTRLPELFGDSEPEPNSIDAFRFDHLYFCSSWLKRETEQAGYKVAHAQVIYPGIKLPNYTWQPKPPGTAEKLLLVSRLHAGCGAMTVVKALQMLRSSRVKASLSIYGRGEPGYVDELRSFVALQRLPVEFLPVSNPTKDLPGIYSRHDVLVYAAEEPEPYSLAPLDAMASGLPVVGTAMGGTADITRHGETALIFPAGNAAELTARVQELIAQPELHQRLIEQARQAVLNNYDETVVFDRIQTLLERAAAQPRAARPQPTA